jgi:predicted TPR repeat methyltransferase
VLRRRDAGIGAEGTADVMVAGDVFIYVGELEETFAEVGRVLRAGGILAFSLERHDGAGFALTQGGRFAHSLEYVRRAARSAGLNEVLVEEVYLRADVGMGWVVVVRKER